MAYKRMQTAFLPVIVALVASPPASASDGSDTLLKKTGPWTMDYALNACHLSASFGEGKNEVKLRFTRIAPQDVVRVTLMGDRFAASNALQSRAQLEFRPTADKPGLSYVTHGTFPQAGVRSPAVFTEAMRLDNAGSPEPGVIDLPSITPEAEKAINGLYVKISGKDAFTLNLASLGPPMAAMRACTDDLVRSWDFDPVEIATRQTRAKPANDAGKWVRPSDYPDAMLSNGASAIVDFRLVVDETGAVANCFVLGSTTPATIGPHSCNILMQRAKFKPSLNSKGEPVKDIYINRIFWRRF